MTHADPSPVSLSEAIENERIELMQVQAMLKCLYEVLLYADDDDSVMHADVANVCARLISESVTRLDAVRLLTLRVNPNDEPSDHKPSDDEPSDDASPPPPHPHQVRDNRATYLC